MMNFTHFFYPKLTLRIPTYPFHSQIDDETLKTSLQDTYFLEAIYLASPHLFIECQKWQNGTLTAPGKIKKLKESLFRYYLRMNNRCTPFGLFAGCSIVEWGEKTNLTIQTENAIRHSRLDMHYLCLLADFLQENEKVKSKLLYFPNSSAYRVGNEIRFMEYKYLGKEKVCQISSVVASEPLLQVLSVCKEGKTIQEMALYLIDDEIALGDAMAFISELIASQLVVSELTPTLTGPEFFYRITSILKKIIDRDNDQETKAILQILLRVENRLKDIDQGNSKNLSIYQQIIEDLKLLDVPIEINKLFQVDKIHTFKDGTLNKALQDDLKEAVEVLSYLSANAVNERLNNFKEHFYRRYEDQEVSLLEALDPESGICYSEFGKNSYSPLTEGLVLTSQDVNEHILHQSEVEHYMYQKFRKADKAGEYSISITKEELKKFSQVECHLPPSFSLVFRLLDDKQNLLIESIGGSSATNLVARFAHADHDFETVVKDLASKEQELNPDVIFPEVCHLPENRTANILLRPALREYEIPYLAQSSLPLEKQIPVQDLFIKIQNGNIILRSKRLNKIIVPRLSTAHNYQYKSLPVYHFLCDLQTDGKQATLGFRWDTVCLYSKFQPRILFKKTILHLATWQLSREDFQCLITAGDDELKEVLSNFCKEWKLPRYFTLADGDNELLIDSMNLENVNVWVSAIKNRDNMRLKEFLFDASKPAVIDNNGKPYVNQFIASLIKDTQSYEGSPLDSYTLKPIQREFPLGSEWLYYKLYCGQKVGNRVLLEAVKPLTDILLQNALIDEWFFIRFADPDEHIRLRLHLKDVQQIGNVISIFHEIIRPSIDNGYIWKCQADTYRRELERYGHTTMKLSETVFFYDSKNCINILEQTHGVDIENTYWILSMKAIDEKLQAFQFSLDDKLSLMKDLKEKFAAEFRMNKSLKLQLDSKYRNHRSEIQALLSVSTPDNNDSHRHVPVSAFQEAGFLEVANNIIYEQKEHQQDDLAKKLLPSYIHMLVNRLISVEARLHEMVIYDFLHRHYTSQKVLSEKSPTPHK